jgi:hypothetical protein
VFCGHIEGNGFPILIDGADIDLSGSVNDVERIMWHGQCGIANLHDLTITNSGGPGMGEYPIHLHLCGDATRGSVVENVTVINGAHHAFVPHGSHGITFLNTAAIDTKGDAYWWDPPGSNETCSFQKFCTLDNSNDIIINGALCDGVTNAPGDDRGFRLSCYTLGAGSGNVIVNSHAQRVQPSHVVDCSGFHWPEGANQNVGGNVWVFEDNTFSDSPCHGIFVWQNDSNLHIIDGFSGGGIDHGAYGNNYDYRHVDVPYLEIHAVGWVMSDSEVGRIILRPHTFAGSVTLTNTTGSVVEVRDAPSGTADEPIILHVNGTNLTCGDVQWVSPHPDTMVFIDGVVCEP